MKVTKVKKAISIDRIDRVRYSVPAAWKKAAGLLKNKLRTDPVTLQRRVRREWDRKVR